MYNKTKAGEDMLKFTKKKYMDDLGKNFEKDDMDKIGINDNKNDPMYFLDTENTNVQDAPKQQADFSIWLGTFKEEKFIWYIVQEFKDITSAYKAFKQYVNTQLKYTDEELQQVWDTGRLDIELKQGTKLLNWVGIYSREVVMDDDDDKPKKKRGSGTAGLKKAGEGTNKGEGNA